MAQKTFVLVSMLKSKATCFGDSIPSNPKRCMSLGAVLMNSGDMGVTSFPSFFLWVNYKKHGEESKKQTTQK